MHNVHSSTVPARLFGASPQVAEFQQICSRTTDLSTYSLSREISHNIPIYDLPALEHQTVTADTISRLQDEWHHILHTGPGVVVLRGMYDPARYSSVLSATNEAFDRIIAREKQSTSSRGDHFAASGTNDRIWNAFSKHASEDPPSFVDYYSNPWLASVCTAWLGPGYRVTAQVNAVHPGGKAQDSHRDYHLGFQEVDICARYPASTQQASQFLTLQGAVAHTKMPESSGPTRFLPFSQTYAPGYLSWRRDEFRAFFQENYVALPLHLGDAVFFNPALFHAAGANEMDTATGGFRRVANLLQISSAFSKPMETIDSIPLIERCWKHLVERYNAAGQQVADQDLNPERFSTAAREIRAFIQAVAEGYPFPTNLDRRPPATRGMTPDTEQDVLVRGLVNGWDCGTVVAVLERMHRDSLVGV